MGSILVFPPHPHSKKKKKPGGEKLGKKKKKSLCARLWSRGGCKWLLWDSDTMPL